MKLNEKDKIIYCSLVPVSVAGQRVPHAPEGGTEQVVQLLRVAHARQTRPVHNPPWGVNI